MASVRRALWLDMRARWRPLLGLVVLLGLVGGAVLACAAGARRTDTAYPRLRLWAHASQLQIVTAGTGPYYYALRRLPGVESVAAADYLNARLPAADGNAAEGNTAVAALSSADNSYGVRTDAVKIVAGHWWRSDDSRAVMVDQQLADAEHLRPGSVFRLKIIPQDPVTGNAEVGRAVTLRLVVAAVAVFDFQIAPATTASSEPAVLLSPPIARSKLGVLASYGTELSVQIRPGASLAGVIKGARALAARDGLLRPGSGFDAVDLTDQIGASQRAILPEAIALAAFAALAGLILLTVASQLLSRQVLLDSADFPVLRALGMSPRQLLALTLARLTTVTLCASALAVTVAILASPLTPIGQARLAEPHPGINVDLAVLGPGFAAILLLPLVLVFPSAWRAAAGPARSQRADRGGTLPGRSPGPAVALSRHGSVTWGLGLRMAFQPGSGRSAVPVRSAQVGTIVAVAATVAALVFGSSFLHLLSSPAQYGQNWQQELSLGFGGVPAPLVTRLASMQPGLQDYAAGDYGEISVNGTLVPALGIDAFRGSGFITMLSGRAPAAANEIALGAQTLQELHLHTGQWARVGTTGAAGSGQQLVTRSMKVVGTVVLPAFGQGSVVDTNLGSGALLAARELSVPFAQTGCSSKVTCYNFVLARYGGATSMRLAAANLATTIRKLGCPPEACTVTSDQTPTDIRSYADVRQTPVILGLVLALLAIGTLAHVLLTGVRRRARDLAIGKALGLGRSQVLSVVLWQALAFSFVAVAIGLPVGALAGRWAWLLFARSAGVPGYPVVPVLGLAAFIPVTLLLAALVAAVPGRTAGRLTPAAVLRAE